MSDSTLLGVQNAVTDLWRIMEKFGAADVKIWQNLTKFNRMPTEFQNSIFHHRNMDSVKFCQIPLKVFKDSLDFYIDLVKFLQKLSDSILFSNGRFELQV